MYQEAPNVEDTEYHHIMYNYETLKLSHESVELKISNVEHDGTLTTSDGLTTVTLNAGETVVPSCGNTPLSAANVLTNTSLSESARHSTPSLSAASPLTGTTNSHGLPLTAVSLSSTNVSSASLPIEHFNGTSVPNALTVATLRDPLEISEIVQASGEEVLDDSIVSSPSIDAVVTSMVASSSCQDVVPNSRKMQSHSTGIAKLLGDDSLSLDMVRIIAEQAVENASGQQQGFNVLTRPGMVVHTKLSDSDIVSEDNLSQYRHVEVLNLRPSLRADDEEATTLCSVVWTCAYCNLAFSSSEAVGQHQEKECTENQSISLATTSSPIAVESLMSPIQQVEDPAYELKVKKKLKTKKEKSTDCDSA